MKKILFVFAFLALGLTLKSECPPEADDFAFTDCRGVEFTLYDILDGGQNVLIEFRSDGVDATRLKEVYHRYGCNGRDLFVMTLWFLADDETALQWLNDQGLESPVVTGEGGAQQFYDLYRDCMEIPKYLLIFSNHEICRESVTYTNMYSVFDDFGILPADCNFGECKAPTNLTADLTPTELKLSWNGVAGARYYHVYKRLNNQVDLFLRDVSDTMCIAYYNPHEGGCYFVVSCCEDGSECASDIVSVPPTALDFVGTDCLGNEIHLFDILDRGQYVLLDFFFYTCPGCRLQEPNVVESYYLYGCNSEDVYYIGVDCTDYNGVCLTWCDEFDVRFPVISRSGGASEICNQYHVQGAPDCFLIAPDHSVSFAHGSYPYEYSFSFLDLQSVVDVYEAIGIEEHYCYDGVYEEKEQNVNPFPNPADDFVNLKVEKSSVIRIYNSLGQMMDSFVAENQQVMIETSSYSEGLYFIQVDGRKLGRFVVSH